MDRVCEVWSASTDLLRPQHAALLDDAERSRVERLSQPADRARATLAAALLRLVGARALDLDPADPEAPRRLRVERGCRTCTQPHGKPSIGHGLHLSVSHAGTLAPVALTRVAPVGVDLEPSTRAAQAQIAARWACDPGESAQIAGGDDALRYWIRKEAIVKASGDGLAGLLAGVQVSAPHEPPRLLRWTGRPHQACTLIDLNPPHGYVASLAVLSRGPLDVIECAADDLLAA